MKTLELDLKKKVFIVDTTAPIEAIEIEGYEFFCKGSELTEEIASELVDETIMYEKHKVKCYRYRSYREGFVAFDSVIESFISGVESKGFYWLENPYDKLINVNPDISSSMVRMVNRINYKEQW